MRLKNCVQKKVANRIKQNKMVKKISLIIVLVLTIVSTINSQEAKKDAKVEKKKQLPSLALGVGALSFDGDIGNGLNLTSLSKIRSGYNLVFEQRIGKVLGLSFNGIFGKLADSERGATRNLNFESSIMQADLNVVLHLDNDFIFKRTSIFAPYLFVGIGYTQFNSNSDLKDKNGNPYFYSKNGLIKDANDTTKILQRDYTYETKLNDSAKYTNSTFAVPLGVGVNLKIVDNFYINLGAAYYLTFTDYIDNLKLGSNDKYLYIKVAFQYNFGKPYDDSNPVYSTIDFSSLDNLDTDEDGVKDGDDRCPGTPKGVPVDAMGCPLDSDGDGVPDHLDKEPLTKAGAFVDANGVTLTEKMIADKQTQYNAMATERSKLFNENPSLKFLKEVEAKSLSERKNKPKGSSNIPFALKPADKNNDGYISTDEIGKAIDAFFEGDSDFTVEKLNDLIDFFFEQ